MCSGPLPTPAQHNWLPVCLTIAAVPELSGLQEMFSSSPALCTLPQLASHCPKAGGRVPKADTVKAGRDLTHFIRSINSTELEAALLECIGSFQILFSGNLLPS